MLTADCQFEPTDDLLPRPQAEFMAPKPLVEVANEEESSEVEEPTRDWAESPLFDFV
jgi:hypothetical protein